MQGAGPADASYDARMQSIWADVRATEEHYAKVASDAMAAATASSGPGAADAGASAQAAQGNETGGVDMPAMREEAAKARRVAAAKCAAGAPDAAAAEEEARACEMILAQMEQNELLHQASMMNIAAQGARDRHRIVGGYMQDVQDDAALRAGVVPGGWKVVRK